jgi:hypothetical protein
VMYGIIPNPSNPVASYQCFATNQGSMHQTPNTVHHILNPKLFVLPSCPCSDVVLVLNCNTLRLRMVSICSLSKPNRIDLPYD